MLPTATPSASSRSHRHSTRRIGEKPRHALKLEPISKLPEEDNEAGELNEAKEVLWMIFPSDEDPALPLIQAKKSSTSQRRKKRRRRRAVLRRRFESARSSGRG